MRSINYKYIIFLYLILIGSVSIGQVKELGKAQETRKHYIDPSSKPGYFSKTPYVNPFIGTGGHGHTYPGATLPFGMIQLSPDTRHEGWDGCSGYHYSDSIIYGFSHTHLSGTGVPDYCDLLLVPQSGKPKVDPGYEVENGYGSHFSHSNEEATPGNYKVHLDDGNIDVELTVTDRCGMHHYLFNETSGKKFLLIDLDHRDKLLCGELNTIDKFTVSGSRISEGWAKEQHFYFYLKLDQPYQKARMIHKDGRNKLLLIFPKDVNSLKVKVGISAVDIDGAKKNLETEMTSWNPVTYKVAATRIWNSELDKITFVSDDKEVMTNFYTALYHSYLNPNLFSDADGRYRGMDNKIHQLEIDEGMNYTVFSLWDTYRATHPLFTLTQVERTNDFIRTFVRQYHQGGDLPVWELAANETDCMIGYHSVSVIADAYMKGIRDYDSVWAMLAMEMTSKLKGLGKKQFFDQGFISSGDEPESVSKTLEYAYDNFCIAQMNRSMLEGSNGMGPYNEFYRSSFNFLNVYDPQTGFMRARRNGLWHSPFDPAEVNFNYTEANSWQYSLYAPHAISVLADYMGGRDSLENWLDRLFTTNSELEGRHQVDITGLIGQYAHGNEPSHHMAYLYNYTNTPHKAQHYLDRIMKEMYHNQPDGLSGNEDCGQMSSWYILSAMGLYQVTPGHPWYDFGRPIMDEAIIKLENGKSLNINTVNNSRSNKYVQQIKWNGKVLKSNQIHHGELIKGGELSFIMGPKPPKTELPTNTSALISQSHFDFVTVPFFTNDQRIFEDSLIVNISHLRPVKKQAIQIEYRLLNDSSTIYTYNEPFTIYENTAIETRQVDHYILDPEHPESELNKSYYSQWVKGEFIKRDKSLQLELKSSYDNQYAAAGPNTLIDGVRGNNEYRTGDWQGYWAKDVIAELNFDNPKKLTELGVGCLRDMKSWIFYPSEILMEVSNDGKNFHSVGNIDITGLAEKDQGPEHRDFILHINETEPVKSVRFTVKNYGKCPDWHLGAGNDTWLFLDELIAK